MTKWCSYQHVRLSSRSFEVKMGQLKVIGQTLSSHPHPNVRWYFNLFTSQEDIVSGFYPLGLAENRHNLSPYSLCDPSQVYKTLKIQNKFEKTLFTALFRLKCSSKRASSTDVHLVWGGCINRCPHRLHFLCGTQPCGFSVKLKHCKNLNWLSIGPVWADNEFIWSELLIKQG